MPTNPIPKARPAVLVSIPEREPTTTSLEELRERVLATAPETTLEASKWIPTLGAWVVWIVAVVEPLAKFCEFN